MQDAQVDALLAAAEAGVACDGLEVTTGPEGYALTVDGERHEGLDGDGIRAIAADHPRYVENWHFWASAVPAGEDRRAFLRWLEDLPAGTEPATETSAAAEGGPEAPTILDRLDHGVQATWGQLHVSVSHAGGGRRSYALTHVEDAPVSEDGGESTLETFEDPLDARQIAKRDDRERYRPLSTAPTLSTGWLFPSLTADDLVRAVEAFYPATIPNWHRERVGDLDVTHWTQTARRQTGIYDVVEELPQEAVDWVAEACCVDSQCLKRREWQYDDESDVAVDGGEGTFPCREPCSLVVAAARKWAILESETERTYEFELTPSEKHQLEELIDAVADGRVDEIREADVNDGANRYRARYLRAKRLDEDGELPDASDGTE